MTPFDTLQYKIVGRNDLFIGGSVLLSTIYQQVSLQGRKSLNQVLKPYNLDLC